MADTGFPGTDAQFDFGRARRRRALSRLANRLRGEPSDVNLILPFEEVVEALGRRGERSLGLQTIDLDSIVGTVDRGREFDRSFRPTSGKVRARWERIAAAQRRGESMPPIDVYRIGELHFVKDGHHRVSVARALGHDKIDAYVTEVTTRVGADRKITLADLPLKSHERLFYERVPLPERGAEAHPASRTRGGYAFLAEGVEAWGFRVMQARGEFMDREEVAEAWFTEEYEPVVEMLREAGVATKAQETDAYVAVVTLRYMLLPTHEWDDEILERVREQIEHPSWEDTQIRSAAEGPSGLDGQVAAVLRVEQLHLRRVHPQLQLLPSWAFDGGLEPRDDLALLAGARHLAGAGVLGQLAQLLRLDRLVRVDGEVGVQLRAHRLQHVDLRLERRAAVLARRRRARRPRSPPAGCRRSPRRSLPLASPNTAIVRHRQLQPCRRPSSRA